MTSFQALRLKADLLEQVKAILMEDQVLILRLRELATKHQKPDVLVWLDQVQASKDLQENL